MDFGVGIVFVLVAIADFALAKWAKSRSNFVTLVAVLCWLLVNVVAVIFKSVSRERIFGTLLVDF